MVEELNFGFFTDLQFWKMCDLGMGDPMPIAKADLSKPYVYDREWGVFFVPMGRHQAAMSLLLAFHLGFKDGLAVAEHLGLKYSSGTADHYLEHFPGTCFVSSQSKSPKAWKRGSLSAMEIRLLGTPTYLVGAEN